VLHLTDAITIEFPQTLVNKPDNPFTWTRSGQDPQNFIVKKQKGGTDSLTGGVTVNANGATAGSEVIPFLDDGYVLIPRSP
jgi:hypothetical protein